MARAVNAAQVWQSRQIDVAQDGAIGDEDGGNGILQLVAYFALAIGRIQQGGEASCECGCVVSSGEFPGIWEEDGDDFTGFEAGGDQAAGKGFDGLPVFRIGEATIDGGVEQRRFIRKLAVGSRMTSCKKRLAGSA